jgi:hypothetical protein
MFFVAENKVLVFDSSSGFKQKKILHIKKVIRIILSLVNMK